ncbi:MAG: DUF3048 domain-containing protein [Clostridia bacterium]|nr:DUF3048 domain-containing protein [Clostridia bacterium]
MKSAKIISSVLAVMLILTSCNSSNSQDTTTTATMTTTVATTAATTTQPAPEFAKNPLTGEYTLDFDAEGKRPVAIMIDNIGSSSPQNAQIVQCGIGEADIVYETLVEGGITRLMAVYSDPSKVSKIGPIRSARYSYVELAYGLDARYVHCGADDINATPLMNSLSMDNANVMNSYGSYVSRISNGQSYEHTLYITGNSAAKIQSSGRSSLNENYVDLFEYNDKKVKYSQSGVRADISFSNQYVTNFVYDKSADTYKRYFNNRELKDYASGKNVCFDNIYILFTTVSQIDSKGHMRSYLDSGSGYCLSGGTATPITWEKGSAGRSLKFYDSDGNVLKRNPGNSYVGITSTEQKPNTTIQ